MATMGYLVAAVSMLASCYQPELTSCRYLCLTSTDCPSDLVCNAGRCAHDGDQCGPPDAAPLRNYYNLKWGPVRKLMGTSDPGGCERRPVLSPDSSTLLVTRPVGDLLPGNKCDTKARTVAFDWNDGSPRERTGLVYDDTAPLAIPSFIIDGREFGQPENVAIVYNTFTGADAAPSTRVVSFRREFTMHLPSTPLVTLDGGSPSFDAAARMVATDLMQDIWVGNGSLNGGYVLQKEPMLSTGNLETSPALSPDGRVIVYVSAPMAGGETSLMTAQRQDVTTSFEPPKLLGEMNTTAYELEPFITATGDLLFTSTREAPEIRRVYFAPAVLP